MEEQDVIQLLRYYQHDVLNELQIIQGYASMQNTEKVQAKIKTFVSLYQKERQLMHLNIPKFTLWLIQTKHKQQNIHLSYDVQSDQVDVSSIDQDLFGIGTLFVEHINEYGSDLELYELHIEIRPGTLPFDVIINWQIKGEIKEIEHLKHQFDNLFPQKIMNLQTYSDKIICEFNYTL